MAPPDPVESAVTVKEIAAQLRKDPIFIQQQSAGGDKAAARAFTRELIGSRPYPVYVVAGALPIDGSAAGARTLAYSLRRELGKDGVYVIAPVARAGTEVIPLGDGLPSTPRNYEDESRVRQETLKRFPDDFRSDHVSRGGDEATQVRLTALSQALIRLHGLGDATMTTAQVDAMAEKQFLHVFTREYDDTGRYSTAEGKRWMVGTFVAVLTALWLPVLITPLVRRRGRKPMVPEQADWHVSTEELERRRAELSRLLAAHSPADVRRPELLDEALLAKEAADTCADSERDTDRLGALTLVERGIHAAKLSRNKKTYVSWRPCFLNPMHGRAQTVRQWVFDDAEIRVPLCEPCARRLDGSRAPQPLLVKQGRRLVPYFEVDDIWGRTGYGSLIEDYAEAVLREGAKR